VRLGERNFVGPKKQDFQIREEHWSLPIGTAKHAVDDRINVIGVADGSMQYQNSQIVQAVKNALLNSSSLNDVIAEI
jgi:hypothetical protein